MAARDCGRRGGAETEYGAVSLIRCVGILTTAFYCLLGAHAGITILIIVRKLTVRIHEDFFAGFLHLRISKRELAREEIEPIVDSQLAWKRFIFDSDNMLYFVPKN